MERRSKRGLRIANQSGSESDRQTDDEAGSRVEADDNGLLARKDHRMAIHRCPVEQSDVPPREIARHLLEVLPLDLLLCGVAAGVEDQ